MSIPQFEWAFTLGQVITFLTLIAGFIYTWKREGRARRWAEEDSARQRQHMVQQDKAIEEGAGAAKEAFSEANAINEKILSLQQQLKHIALRKGDRPPDKFTRKTDQGTNQ